MIRLSPVIYLTAIALLTACGAASENSDVKSARSMSALHARGEGCYRPQDADLCAMAGRIFELTNALRAMGGRRPLAMHAGWSHVADVWSAGQVEAGAISHDGFPEARLAAYEKEFGTADRPALGAENVGRVNLHTDDIETVAVAFADGWFKSPVHYRNMMGDFGTLGVGLARDGTGYYYATQIFAGATAQ